MDKDVDMDMEQAFGFNLGKLGQVRKLNKAIYGTRRAGKYNLGIARHSQTVLGQLKDRYGTLKQCWTCSVTDGSY